MAHSTSNRLSGALHLTNLEVQELCQGEGWVSDQGGAHHGSQLGPVPLPEYWIAQSLQHCQVALHRLHRFCQGPHHLWQPHSTVTSGRAACRAWESHRLGRGEEGGGVLGVGSGVGRLNTMANQRGGVHFKSRPAPCFLILMTQVIPGGVPQPSYQVSCHRQTER